MLWTVSRFVEKPSERLARGLIPAGAIEQNQCTGDALDELEESGLYRRSGLSVAGRIRSDDCLQNPAIKIRNKSSRPAQVASPQRCRP